MRMLEGCRITRERRSGKKQGRREMRSRWAPHISVGAPPSDKSDGSVGGSRERVVSVADSV